MDILNLLKVLLETTNGLKDTACGKDNKFIDVKNVQQMQFRKEEENSKRNLLHIKVENVRSVDMMNVLQHLNSTT